MRYSHFWKRTKIIAHSISIVNLRILLYYLTLLMKFKVRLLGFWATKPVTRRHALQAPPPTLPTAFGNTVCLKVTFFVHEPELMSSDSNDTNKVSSLSLTFNVSLSIGRESGS
jgi:hypothetical protein